VKSLKDQILTRCVHFTGIQHDACEAGIDYKTVRDASAKGPYRWPCFSDSGATTVCPKASFMTDEQAAAEEKSMIEKSDAVIAALGRGEHPPGVIACGAHDLHPFDCGGTEEGCIHCKGEKTEHHDPDNCALCKGFDEEPPL